MEENRLKTLQEIDEAAIDEDIEREKQEHKRRKTIEKFLTSTAAVCLSIMSVIISIVSLSTDADSKKIAEKELDILTNDREAYFVLETDKNIYKEVTDRGTEEYLFSYTVKNEGGRVSGFRITPYSLVQIYTTYYRPPEFSEETGELVDEGCSYEAMYNVKIKNVAYTGKDKYDTYNYDVYDAQTKTFTVNYRYPKMILDMIKSVESKLSDLQYLDAVCARVDGAEIRYCNYKNEQKAQKYMITKNSIAAGGEVTFDGIESKNITFEFTDYGEEDAEKLAKAIERRLTIDLYSYEKGLEKQKTDAAD